MDQRNFRRTAVRSKCESQRWGPPPQLTTQKQPDTSAEKCFSGTFTKTSKGSLKSLRKVRSVSVLTSIAMELVQAEEAYVAGKHASSDQPHQRRLPLQSARSSNSPLHIGYCRHSLPNTFQASVQHASARDGPCIGETTLAFVALKSQCRS